MRSIIAISKLLIFALWNIVVILTQGPAMLLLDKNGKGIYVIPRLWYKITCDLFGIKTEIIGAPRKNEQTLFVGNHLSYLDIPALGGVLPYASFVAKEDVANWPLFGTLAKFQQTAFISRSRHKAAAGKYALANMVKNDKSIILFPEGTSTPGTDVLPFKSSLFSIAMDNDLTLQPVTIALETVDGKSANDLSIRDLYAWHGDMTMLPHLWAFAKGHGAKVKIIFHPPCTASQFKNRKELADHCQKIVADELERNLDMNDQTQAA